MLTTRNTEIVSLLQSSSNLWIKVQKHFAQNPAMASILGRPKKQSFLSSFFRNPDDNNDASAQASASAAGLNPHNNQQTFKTAFNIVLAGLDVTERKKLLNFYAGDQADINPVSVNVSNLTINIWDIDEADSNACHPHGKLIFMDLTNNLHVYFESIRKSIQEHKENFQGVPLILVGYKCNSKNRKVTPQEFHRIATIANIESLEVSNRKDRSPFEALETLVDKILEKKPHLRSPLYLLGHRR